MDDEIVAATHELLGYSRTLTPAMVWCWPLDRRVSYRAVMRTLEAMAKLGMLECVDPFALAYRRPRAQLRSAQAGLWRQAAQRFARRRHAPGRGMRLPRATPRPAM